MILENKLFGKKMQHRDYQSLIKKDKLAILIFLTFVGKDIPFY